MATLERIKIGANIYTVATPYCVCNTAAEDPVKIVALENFSLDDGAIVRIKFLHNNVAENPILNINNTGNKNIIVYGTLSSKIVWSAGAIVEFTYDAVDSGKYVINSFGESSPAEISEKIVTAEPNTEYLPLITENGTISKCNLKDFSIYYNQKINSIELDGGYIDNIYNISDLKGQVYFGAGDDQSGSKNIFNSVINIGKENYSSARVDTLCINSSSGGTSYVSDSFTKLSNLYIGSSSSSSGSNIKAKIETVQNYYDGQLDTISSYGKIQSINNYGLINAVTNNNILEHLYNENGSSIPGITNDGGIGTFENNGNISVFKNNGSISTIQGPGDIDNLEFKNKYLIYGGELPRSFLKYYSTYNWDGSNDAYVWIKSNSTDKTLESIAYCDNGSTARYAYTQYSSSGWSYAGQYHDNTDSNQCISIVIKNTNKNSTAEINIGISNSTTSMPTHNITFYGPNISAAGTYTLVIEQTSVYLLQVVKPGARETGKKLRLIVSKLSGESL